MAQVVLENVAKCYTDKSGLCVHAVREVNLTVQSSEFMVLVGPSGCGKSTLLRMIAGLEAISGGRISIDGRVVNDVPPKDRDIAMVFQNYALYPHLSVYENLAFGLKLRKVPAKIVSGRVREAASMLGLEGLLDRLPRALSGGQRQRVAIGRAIVRQPKVFLFDEPLSNLDAKMRIGMRAEISKLHAQLGATMIYVTHDQVEAMTMGDRICVLKDGRVQQISDPLELYRRPTNAFVGGFIGSPSMNLLSGKLSRDAEGLRFVQPGEENGGLSLRLPQPCPEAERLVDRRKVILGIRPEDLRLESASSDAEAVAAQIELTEPLGAETYLHLRAGSNRLTARVSGDTVFSDRQRVWIRPDPHKLHFFDDADESRRSGA